VRAVVQRVSRAEVRVDGEVVGSIGPGFAILLGVGQDDDERVGEELARRLATVRMFADEAGRTNRSIHEIGGSALVVSQFTLYADVERGRRPGFSRTADPASARRIYEAFCASLAGQGVPVERGRFGEEMELELVNEGPFTLWWDVAGPTPGRSGDP
jgi:D-tyrosyl-tRNA(Tyr) deacylase